MISILIADAMQWRNFIVIVLVLSKKDSRPIFIFVFLNFSASLSTFTVQLKFPSTSDFCFSSVLNNPNFAFFLFDTVPSSLSARSYFL